MTRASNKYSDWSGHNLYPSTVLSEFALDAKVNQLVIVLLLVVSYVCCFSPFVSCSDLRLSCKPNIYVSWSTSELRVLNRFKPSSKIFYWPFQWGAFFCWSFMLCLSCFLCFHARLFVDALWSPARKGLTPWLSFVMSYCDVVTFPLVTWVRCGAWLYRFLIFAVFLILALSDYVHLFFYLQWRMYI